MGWDVFVYCPPPPGLPATITSQQASAWLTTQPINGLESCRAPTQQARQAPVDASRCSADIIHVYYTMSERDPIYANSTRHFAFLVVDTAMT